MASPVGIGYQKADPQTLRTLAFGGVSGTYARVGSLFGQSIQYLYMVTDFNANVTVSLDGINDFAVLVPNFPFQVIQLGVTFPGYLGVYVKGTVASGSIYVTTIGVA